MAEVYSADGLICLTTRATQLTNPLRSPVMQKEPSTDQPLATRDDIRRLERDLIDLRLAVERNTKELSVQLTRIGQLQAEMDLVRSAWTKAKTLDVQTESDGDGTERRRGQRKPAR
jgi:hypothetical protein